MLLASVSYGQNVETINYTNGVYVGEVRDDERNGQGTFSSDELVYTGGFRDNKFHGRGIAKSGDMTMEGQFLNNVPVGTHTGLCGSNNWCTTLFSQTGEFIEGTDLLSSQAEAQNRRLRERLESTRAANRQRAFSRALINLGSGLISGPGSSSNSGGMYQTCNYNVLGEIVPFPVRSSQICPLSRDFGRVTGLLQ
jgi:hypothetical protein